MLTDDSVHILATDAISGLRSLPSHSVQVSLTSPPFYLLRRYGTSTTWPDGWEGELGHEPHPNDFVRHLLHVFDEVWRVLRDDGCLWVNLADTYNNRKGKRVPPTLRMAAMAASRLGDEDTPSLYGSNRSFSNTMCRVSATSPRWEFRSVSTWL